MRKRNKLWSYALAGALAVSNMAGVVALPATSIVAMADAQTVTWSGLAKATYYQGEQVSPVITLGTAVETSASHKLYVAWTKGSAAELPFTVGQTVPSQTVVMTGSGTNFVSSAPISLTTTSDATFKFQAWDVTFSTVESHTSEIATATKIGTTTSVDVKATKVAGDISISPEFVDIDTSSDDADTATTKEGIEITTVATLNTQQNTNTDILDYSVYKKTDFETHYTAAKAAYETKNADYLAAVAENTRIQADETATEQAKIDAAAAVETAKGLADDAYAAILDETGDLTDYTTTTFDVTDSGTMNSLSGLTWTEKKILSTSGAEADDYVLFVSEAGGDILVNNYYEFKAVAQDASFVIGTWNDDEKIDVNPETPGTEDGTAIASLTVDKTVQLHAQTGTVVYQGTDQAGYPKVETGKDNRTPVTNVTWSVPTASVGYLSVDSNGLVTALKAGTNKTVVATYKNATNVTSKATFTVKAIAAPGVSIASDAEVAGTEPTTTTIGKNVKFTASVDGEEQTSGITWTVYQADSGSAVADSKKAEIDANGNFMAYVAGTYYVGAKYNKHEVEADRYTIKAEDAELAIWPKKADGTPDEEAKTLTVGSTLPLYARFSTGDNAYWQRDEVVTWEVKDAYKDYISVDNKGLVTALKATPDTLVGGVQVTANYVIKDKAVTSKTYTITAIENPEITVKTSKGDSGTIDSPATVAIGNKLKLVAYVDGKSQSSDISWTVYQASSGTTKVTSDVASVDANGNFTASVENTYFVVATYDKYDASNFKKRFVVKAEAAEFAIGFKSGEIEGVIDARQLLLYPGDTLNLKATYGGNDITSDSNVVWTTSDPSYATVSKGVVTVIKGDEEGREIDVKATYTVGSKSFETEPVTLYAFADEANIRDEVGTNTYGRATVIVGKTLQLALYNGSVKDTQTKVNWVTDDDKIADVSSTGLVTAKKVGGPVEIWAVDATTGKKLAEFNVYVEKATISVEDKNKHVFFEEVQGDAQYDATFTLYTPELSNAPESLNVGETVTLQGLFGGDVVNGKWTSGNNDAASVNSTSGLVTIKGLDYDTVEETVGEGADVQTITWIVYEPAEVVFEYEDSKALVVIPITKVLADDLVPAITITDEQGYNVTSEYDLNEITVAVNGTDQLVVLNGTTDVTSKFNFKSNNDSVATVDSKGLVTGKKQGTAKITATAKDGSGVSVEIGVTVLETLEVEAVALEKLSLILEIGKSETIAAVVEPVGTTEKLTWTSSDASIATVANGVVTAVAEGKATITAQAGGVFAKATVTVVKSAEQVQKEKEQAEKTKSDAIAAATTAANAAASNPTDANLAALEKAIADAKAAGVDDADIKAAQEKLTAAYKTAKTNSDTAKVASDKKAADAATDAANQKKAADAAKAEAEKNQKALDKANAKVATSETIAKLAGKTKKVSGSSYKTDADGGKSVTVTKAKNAKTVTIGKTVKISKNTYKVRSIKAKAFTGKKIRTLKINGANLLFVDNSAFTGTKATKITVTNAKNVKAQLKAAAGAAGLKFKAKGNTVTITKK